MVVNDFRVELYSRNVGHAALLWSVKLFMEIRMRILIGLVALAATLSAAQSGKNKHQPEPGPKQGIKTPGMQIPFASLKADAELPLAPRWIVFSDTVLIPNKAGGLERLDAKTNKLVDPGGGCERNYAAARRRDSRACGFRIARSMR